MIDETTLAQSDSNEQSQDFEDLQSFFRCHLNQGSQERLTGIINEINFSNVDPSLRPLALEIVSRGTYKGQELGLPEAARNSAGEIDERNYLWKVLVKDPETLEALAVGEVAGFHVTNSYALAGLIEDGAMLSSAELKRREKPSITGAHDVHENGLSAISFGQMNEIEHNLSQWGGREKVRTNEEVMAEMTQDISDAYAKLERLNPNELDYKLLLSVTNSVEKALENFRANPNSLAATMMRIEFPVVMGVNRSYVRNLESTRTRGRLLSGQSHYTEFRPATEVIPIDEITVLAVPEGKISGVKALLAEFGHKKTQVIALEPLKV